MTGEAQVYEPFLIQPLRRFFQQLDLLLIVFNQIIVVGKDGTNSFLNANVIDNINFQIRKCRFGYIFSPRCSTGIKRFQPMNIILYNIVHIFRVIVCRWNNRIHCLVDEAIAMCHCHFLANATYRYNTCRTFRNKAFAIFFISHL